MASILTSLGYQIVLNTKFATVNVDVLKATGASGLQLQDDGGNLGIFIEDGGQVGINEAAPDYPLQVVGVNAGADIILLCLQNDSVTTTSGAGIRLVASTDPDNAGFGVGEIITTRDASGNADMVFKTRGSTDGYGTKLKIDYDGNVIQTLRMFMINETSNAKMTHGITLNQGSIDNEILAFKSSDVAHGMTTLTETDTYGNFQKLVGGTGGLEIMGFSSANYGIYLSGVTTAGSVSRFSSATAPIILSASRKSGTTQGGLGAGHNLVIIRDFNTGVWQVDQLGNTYQAGSAFLGGETLNANMTVGLTINQGAADNQVLAFKSSDIAHALVAYAETDTYASFYKRHATDGGLEIYSIMADVNNYPSTRLFCVGGQAPTTKSSSGEGLLEIRFSEHDGANALTDITADGNLIAVRARKSSAFSTVWILDEDGDTWQSGDIKCGHVTLNVSSWVTWPSHGSQATSRAWGISKDQTDWGLFVIRSSDADDQILDTDRMTITRDGLFCLNIPAGTGNANMTQGLTINQGANDDEILAFKSSDVAHGYTAVAETDTYATFQKSSDLIGGLLVRSLAEDDAGTPVSLAFKTYGGQAETTKSSEGEGLVSLYMGEISGGAIADVTANGNIFALIPRKGSAWSTAWLCDEDGDTWQSGAIVLGGSVTAGSAMIVPNGSTFGWVGGQYFIYANTASRMAFYVGGVYWLRIYNTGFHGINETENANMNIGITINQAGQDTEILAFKSSDVNHSYTTYTENDTYAVFAKANGADGGLEITGIRGQTDGIALWLRGINCDNTPAVAAIVLRADKGDGADSVEQFADGEIFLEIANGSQECLSLFGGPQLGVGANPVYNTKMTQGITIDQAANDDEILAFKSSDVGHAATHLSEADTFGSFVKSEATSGGLIIYGFKDADGVASLALRLRGFLSEDANTTKSTAGRGILEFYASQATGGASQNVVADGNLLSIRCRKGGTDSTVWIVDEDGDTWQSGNINVGAKLIYMDGYASFDYVTEANYLRLSAATSVRLRVGGSESLNALSGGEIELATLANLANDGAPTTHDHGTATDPEIVSVVYGTGSPPAASGTPIGTLWIKYTA